MQDNLLLVSFVANIHLSIQSLWFSNNDCNNSTKCFRRVKCCQMALYGSIKREFCFSCCFIAEHLKQMSQNSRMLLYKPYYENLIFYSVDENGSFMISACVFLGACGFGSSNVIRRSKDNVTTVPKKAECFFTFHVSVL